MNQKKDQEVSPLRKLREQSSLSQPELGRLVGVSDRNIRDWESGVKLPRIDRAVALAKALNVPLKVLVKTFGLDVSGIPDDED